MSIKSLIWKYRCFSVASKIFAVFAGANVALALLTSPVTVVSLVGICESYGRDRLAMLLGSVFVMYDIFSIIIYLCAKNDLIEKLFSKICDVNYAFFSDGTIYFLPYIQQLCRLNIDCRNYQKEFFIQQFGKGVLPLVFDHEITASEMEDLKENIKNFSLTKKSNLVNLLFKISIIDDGIRLDEWNFLMQLMTEFKFNKNYFEFYKKRYSSLRTEFDEEEQKRKASLSTERSVSFLKTYFAILGLQEGASDDEIKKAYHALALQHHPDLPKNADRIQECEAMMAKINEAYEKIRG